MKKSNFMLLPAIIVIAVVLRLTGISHGFPLILHPDEPTVVQTALALRFYPNPGHFDWPHLYMYSNYFVYMVFAFLRNVLMDLGLKTIVSAALPLLWNDTLIFYLITRIMSAILGALTVIPIYLAARNTFGKRVGLLSALSFAVIPFHVWHSHYALIDVPMLFFVSWGAFFALSVLRKNSINDYAGAGFYIGLAASTKYNGGLTIITVPLAHLIRVIKNKEKLFNTKSFSNLATAVLMSILGFLLGTPYALLDFNTFSRKDNYKGAFWQFKNVGSIDLSERIPKFFNEMIYKVADDLGYTILIGFFLVFCILIYRAVTKKHLEEDTTLWFLVISGISFLFYISGFSRSRSHYYFIAYPYIVMCFGYFADLLLRNFLDKKRLLGFLIFTLLIGPPFALSLRSAYTFASSDTRLDAYTWLEKNLKTDEVIVFSSSALSTTLEKIKNKKVKGELGFKNNPGDVLVVSYDNNCNCTDFPLSKYAYRLKKITEFSGALKHGPKIEIYSINK